MTRVVFELADGTTQQVDAEPGESIMQAATRHNVPGIIGECGGEMSCATCHVYLAGPEPFPPRSADEAELLELVDDCRDESRLSCQLRVTITTSEVTLKVPGALRFV